MYRGASDRRRWRRDTRRRACRSRRANPDAIFKLPRIEGVHSFILMSILNDRAHVMGLTATQIITYSKLFSTYHSTGVQ